MAGEVDRRRSDAFCDRLAKRRFAADAEDHDSAALFLVQHPAQLDEMLSRPLFGGSARGAGDQRNPRLGRRGDSFPGGRQRFLRQFEKRRFQFRFGRGRRQEFKILVSLVGATGPFQRPDSLRSA